MNTFPNGGPILALAAVLLLGGPVIAGEIRVVTSGGFAATYDRVVPEYERLAGDTVRSAYGASMGGAPDSIPMRLERGEPMDVVILAASALDALIEQGTVIAGSRVELARSRIGMAVRAGAPRPDISTVDALRQTLVRAASVGYSASASGIYLSAELFPQLEIGDEMREKSVRVESDRVGNVVARGEVELGFQQISELLPIEGIDYVGPLPEEVQRITVFAAGIVEGAENPDGARAFIRYLASPEVARAIIESGMDPAE